MAYLISHIAICLVFAQLLGLLLGWLLWGYVARQRGKEVLVLRERIADMQVMSARRAVASEPRAALPDIPVIRSAPIIDGELESNLPERVQVHEAFFEDEDPEFAGRPFESTPVPESRPAFEARHSLEARTSATQPAPVAPDLEAEVREARVQHLQQQVRDLESVRDRLPLLQADLSDAIAGRKSAEARFQEAKNDFEVRSSGLLSQIKDFEVAAGEWDRNREQLELEKIANEKELSAVKATLRDLQNSQRPQTVDVPVAPSASAIELADLRERYQRALRERDSIAAELEFWKQSDGDQPHDSHRVAELEEGIRSRDTQLTEQAARVESLLWRVAELEPFAAEAPEKEENLRRQESEIAGHIEMHSENAERIRSLQNHIAELQATTITSEELQRIISEHQEEMQKLTQSHEQKAAELQQSLAMKDDEITEHVSARYGQLNLVNGMQARIAELEVSAQRMKTLEKLLTDRDNEIRAILAAHSETQQEMETWKAQAGKLEPLAAQVPDLQSSLKELTAAHVETQRDLETWKAKTTALEPVAAQVPDLQFKLKESTDAHSGTKSELENWRTRANKLEPIAARMPDLELALQDRAEELRRWKELHADTEGQLTFLQERLGALSGRLAAHQQRLQQIEPLAARTPELEKQLLETEREARERVKNVEERHQAELNRLKVNSAQRLRRLRQGITSFKG